MRYAKQRKRVSKRDIDYIKDTNIIQWYNVVKQRQHNKTWYLYKNVKYYLTMSKHAYFITLTLKQEKLKLKKATLIYYIKQQLNDLDLTKWILNDDYGDLKNRLHFHALLFTEHNLLEHPLVIRRKQHYNLTSWDSYGFSQIKPINNELDYNNLDKTTKRISKYISKLSRHAQKGTTLKLWYSRNKKDLIQNNKFTQSPSDP